MAHARGYPLRLIFSLLVLILFILLVIVLELGLT